MPVSIIVGGQYGSEGKGKVAYQWAKTKRASVAVKVGGTNSGHTIYHNGEKHVFRVLPAACVLKDVTCVLPAGSYIDLTLLSQEMEEAHITKDRVKIDPNAVILTNAETYHERLAGIGKAIGSTESGTGAGVMKRIERSLKMYPVFAHEVDLPGILTNTKKFLRDRLSNNEEVVIEGTQGYGLSVLHSKTYPFVTARDTTAAGFLSETGLSPFDVRNIVMVVRTYPIRVAGNSGPLKNEIDWETVTKESGSKEPIMEKTSVTHNVRRVARFDPDLVKDAIIANNPNVLVLNHVDYFDKTFETYKSGDERYMFSRSQVNKIFRLETQIGRSFDFFGVGPEEELIPRNSVYDRERI